MAWPVTFMYNVLKKEGWYKNEGDKIGMCGTQCMNSASYAYQFQKKRVLN